MSRTLPVKEALRSHWPDYKRALYYSLVIGALSLMPTVFMLEVYDRVVNSRNSTTLLMLMLLVLGSYVLQEVLELVRHRILYGVARKLDTTFRQRIFDVVFEISRLRGGAGNTQPFSDLRQLMDFIHSAAVTAMLDAPMALVFLLLVFIISPWLGVAALVGALIQVWIATITERDTMPALTQANRAAIDAQGYASSTLRNAQVIEAMGMMGNVHKRWMTKQRNFLSLQAIASDTAGLNNAASKFIQTLQTSLLLGGACWLALNGMMLGGGGMMMVASILGGKVLAPLVQLVAQWRLVVNARDAYQRLESALSSIPEKTPGMPLPPPRGHLTVEGVVAGAPGSPVPIVRNVSFAIQPGECVMLVGPSGAGKTSLARLIMGLWPAGAGKVRLDGADVFAWNKAELGPHVGYLPQTVELFDGTVAENIARFGDVDRDKVQQAIRRVGLDDLMAQLPHGADTRLGDDGAVLSGGQRQRVALARAIYGLPKLLVLDEPNSSLDQAGEQALLQTLAELKAAGSAIIVITHRTSVLPAADKILLLRDGTVAMFGPRDEVLAALQRGAQPPASNAATPVAAQKS